MDKIILIPDSFKGTMDSLTICGIMEAAVRQHYPQAHIVSLPVADGGEGSVDSFLHALGGEKITLRVKGPRFEDLDAFYGLVDQGRTAVIEMAACAGLPLMGDKKDPLASTTYGVGQLMLDAASRGVKRIILGLGGSATNDGGCGAAAAAGVKFFDRAGEPFIPVGANLHLIDKIDLTGNRLMQSGIEVIAMCDIDNPLYGPKGAAHVFAPQKGASETDVELLDAGLRHLATVIKEELGKEVDLLPGSGAAGGMGAGAYAFFDASLEAGIEVVLDLLRFEEVTRDANLVLTGEGKIDGQSLGGKVVVGVARRAKKQGVPVVAIVGDIEDPVEPIYSEGVIGIFSINRLAIDFAQARQRSHQDLALTVDNLMRFIKQLGI